VLLAWQQGAPQNGAQKNHWDSQIVDMTIYIPSLDIPKPCEEDNYVFINILMTCYETGDLCQVN
jgi:hypothetical protein